MYRLAGLSSVRLDKEAGLVLALLESALFPGSHTAARQCCVWIHNTGQGMFTSLPRTAVPAETQGAVTMFISGMVKY